MSKLRRYLYPAPWPEGLPFLLLLLITAGLPLLMIPAAMDSFVLAKETVFRCAVMLLLGTGLVMATYGGRLRLYLRPLNGFVFLFFIWSVLSVFWADAPVLAKEESLRTGLFVLYFFLFQSIVGGDRHRLLVIAYGLATASFIIAASTVFRDFRAGFSPESISVRSYLGDWRDYLLTVFFGNTSHLADFLVAGFLIWLGIFIAARARATKAVSLAALWLHAAALIAAWSVHSNLSLIIAIGAAVYTIRFYFGKEHLRRLKTRGIILVAGWAVVAAFYAVDHPLNPHASAQWAPRIEAAYQQAGIEIPPGGFSGGIFSQAFASPRWTSGFDTRLAIWYQTLDVIRNNTWFGAGAGSFTWTYPAALSPLLLNNPGLAQYAGTWTNAAHNDLLQTWSELGVIGAFLLVVITVLGIKNYWDRLQAGTSFGNALILAVGMAILAGQIVQAQMNFPLQLPVSTLMFFVVLSIPYILPRRGSEEQALLVPVERPFGSIRIGVLMKNMAYPTQFNFRIRTKPAKAAMLLIIPLALILWAAWSMLAPLRADIRYRAVYDNKQRMNAGVKAYTGQVVSGARDVLEIWPAHVDARSTLQDALLRTGQYEEVVEQTPLVLEKLNAIEVYLRRARALEALGRASESIPDWDVIFTRKPEAYAPIYPSQFNAYLDRHPELAREAAP